MAFNNLFARPLQALSLASVLTLGAPAVGLMGCSTPAHPSDESGMVTSRTTAASGLAPVPPPPFGSAPVISGPAQLMGNPQAVLSNGGVSPSAMGPTMSVPAAAHDNTLLVLTSILAALGAISTVILTWQHLKLRRDQAYAASRALGLTLEEDIRRMEKRLEKSAGNRDHWHTEFLTDLGKVALNGLLRPAKCREDDIVDLMNLRKRQLPVISTVVAPSGAGKSRMVEGLIHALYHDRAGHHYTSPDFNPKNRLFPDIDPANLICYRLNLGQLTHPDAEPMFHYLMQKADRGVKQGGKCLVIIDDANYLFGPNGHASAARLIHLIDGWTDGQMKDSKGFWGIAMMPIPKYDELIQNNPSRRRRFERYDMTVLSGGRLRAVVDEILDEWEGRLNITIPEDVRDRVVEIMAHPANDMANPYASLNLLDRIQAGLPPMEKTMTRDDLHYTFARLHRLNVAEVAQWTLYAHVQESILAELAERFPFLPEKGPNLIPYLSLQILNAWKQGDQSLMMMSQDADGQDADGQDVDGVKRRRMIPEVFIEKPLQFLYEKVEGNPLQFHGAQGIIAEMRKGDLGDRQHRQPGIKKLASAPSSSDRRSAANG